MMVDHTICDHCGYKQNTVTPWATIPRCLSCKKPMTSPPPGDSDASVKPGHDDRAKLVAEADTLLNARQAYFDAATHRLMIQRQRDQIVRDGERIAELIGNQRYDYGQASAINRGLDRIDELERAIRAMIDGYTDDNDVLIQNAIRQARAALEGSKE